jgi:hypothetical protein
MVSGLRRKVAPVEDITRPGRPGKDFRFGDSRSRDVNRVGQFQTSFSRFRGRLNAGTRENRHVQHKPQTRAGAQAAAATLAAGDLAVHGLGDDLRRIGVGVSEDGPDFGPGPGLARLEARRIFRRVSARRTAFADNATICTQPMRFGKNGESFPSPR